MKYEDLLLEKKGGIGIITLNAPEQMNAITRKMKRSFVSAVEEMSRDDGVRVVIITGAGHAFCAGGDIEIMKARIEGSLDESRYERLELAGSWIAMLLKMDKPVIASVNGPAVGAGLSIVMASDIRLASEKAKFGSVFISRGLIPDSGLTYLLPRAVGTCKALELMLTGNIINAEEAISLGIINQVVPHDQLMETALELATKITLQPPIAVELTKRLVNRSIIENVARHLDWETYGQQLCWRTEDFRESTLAFLEKRPQPHFKGK